MKIRTLDLTGPALDWAVAKCTGHQSRCEWMVKEGWNAWQSYEAAWGNPIPDYSTNWAQGGPIIERELLQVSPEIGKASAGNAWWAVAITPHEAYGPTPLIAAMRCFVSSIMGDEIDIPNELT